MTHRDLRKKGIDIVIHPMIIGLDDGKNKKAYTYSIFDNEEELGSWDSNPDFDSYEEAEDAALEKAVIHVQTQEN